MAKKEFRIKDKQGNNVDYGIPSSRVMLGNGNSLDEVLEGMQDEINEADGEAVKKVTFNGGTPATPDEQGNVTINQVKSDWRESDNTSPKFIEHKPDVVENVFYEVQTRTLKKTVNGVTQEVMTMPQPGSDITINDSMDGPGANPARTDVIKQYIDAVSQRLDALVSTGNVQGVIDTFNEIKAFLVNFNESDTLAAELYKKVDKESGKGLSTNDYTTEEKQKLAGIEAGAEANPTFKTINNESITGSGNISIPAGQDGADGQDGQDGADGKSAYQVAVDNGFVGNVAAWLASLKGETGAPGPAGPKGDKGDQGNSGVASADGVIVVNNLTEGGYEVVEEGETKVKVLSAEQGKRLAPLLELIGSVEHPSVTDSVALTSGKRYDGNLYNQPTNGTFTTTTNSSSSWGCAAVDVKEGDVLKIIGSKSGADYRIYTIVDASNQRIAIGSAANGQSYTSESPLEVTMPANAAKVYVNLTYSGAAVSVVRSAWTEIVINRATTLQDGLMTAEQVAAFEELSAIVEEMGANSELLSTLIENVTIPATTKNVQMTSGGRYDGNYYNTGNTGVFPTTINSNSGWSYGNIACKEGDVLTIVGSKSGADYKIYTIVDADNKRISSGASSNQTYTSGSPLEVTMPANAAKVYINLSSVTSVKLTEPSYNEDQLRKATTEQDGLMTKEQVAALDAAGGEDVELLKSYIVDRTDTMTGTFVVGNLKNWNVAIGATYNGGLGDDNQNMVYCVFSVQAGDIVTLWCTTDAWNQGYIICDSSNKVIAKSGNNYSKSQSSPKVITIEQDGKIWIASNKSASYGASLSRTYRAFRNATAEQDGLMPKEIAALFGGDVSGDDAASLKLKSFAFIGDSFSAPGSWQSTMCSVLGAMVKANKAVSGGAWHGSDSLSAYYQAQQLVSANQAADYILCVLGTNDIANNVSLGDIVNSQTIGSASGNVNPATVTGGIQATLITLKKAFPNAIIKIGYTPAGQLHDSFSSMAAVEALCNRLKEVGIMYGVDYIETRTCGISRSLTEDRLAWEGNTEGASYTGHPSGAGQTRIGQYMARKMLCNL